MWTPENRTLYDRSHLRYPSDVTDKEWELIKSQIAPAKRGGRKREVDEREIVNAIMYVLHRLPMAGVAEGFSAEKHGVALPRFVELRWDAGAHPSRALREVSREGRTRSKSNSRHC